MGTTTPSRTAEEDERFIESFKQYVNLLVDESCSELMGKEPVPKDKFEEAGHKLVEASRNLKITQKVEGFVGMVNQLAEYRLLAPEPGAICSTPSGNSIGKFRTSINGLKGYFEKAGLTLSADVGGFEGRPIIDMCLGEAKTIDLPVGPKVTIFTKTIIKGTGSTIGNRVLGISHYSDWTDSDGIFQLIEPKLDNGRTTLFNLRVYPILGLARKSHINEKDKLDELAWTRLLLESDGNEEVFIKKYATTSIENNYSHEIYHQQIAKFQGDSTSTEEAAAQLYAISRNETNPFDCLRFLYNWREGKKHKYSHAAKLAFIQLKKASYAKSLWNGLDAGDIEKVKTAGSEIRRLADLALTNLEAGMGWRNHKEVEDETGLERNYPILHTELEKVGGAKHGK